MAGFVPNEGETLIAQVVHKRTHVDRDANLELGLFLNSSVSETTVLGDLVEPTGTGYARKTLTDASWTVTGDNASYATQQFVGGVGGWTGPIYGYFVATKAAGGTPRLLFLELAATPFTLNSLDTYDVTLSISYA